MSHRIALLIPALHGGGAERATAALADHWVERGHCVTLITLDQTDSDVFPVDSRVQRVGLGLMRDSAHKGQGLCNNVRRLRRVREAIRGAAADVVVSLTDKMNIVTLLASWGMRLPVVIGERSDPRQQRLGAVWEWLRRRSYPRCDAAVVQTEAVASQMRGLIDAGRVHVIPNAVSVPSVSWKASLPHEPRIVAVGRLSREKGFDLLIQAFFQLADRHQEWQLLIVGEGQQREPLAQLAGELGIAHRVQMPGWVDAVESLVCSSRVFALPSRYEGFPNALLEAMALGAPVISFDCASGPREIIRHGVDGLLVPAADVNALADGIERLMSDESLRVRLGSRRTRSCSDSARTPIFSGGIAHWSPFCRRTRKRSDA